MQIIQFVLVAIEVISSLLLIILILVQKSKSEGLGLAFGSGMGEALFGSRAGNVLTKLTIIFTAVFLANTLLLSIVYAGARSQSIMGRRIGRMGAAPMAAPGGAPAAGQQRAPAAQSSAAGAPTLPGANFEDQGVPAAPPVDAAPSAQPEGATP